MFDGICHGFRSDTWFWYGVSFSGRTSALQACLVFFVSIRMVILQYWIYSRLYKEKSTTGRGLICMSAPFSCPSVFTFWMLGQALLLWTRILWFLHTQMWFWGMVNFFGAFSHAASCLGTPSSHLLKVLPASLFSFFKTNQPGNRLTSFRNSLCLFFQ